MLRQVPGARVVLVVAGGALYRVDTYLTAYNPGTGWTYMPSIGEITVTVGMAAAGIAVFIFISRLLPIVVVQDARDHSSAGA